MEKARVKENKTRGSSLFLSLDASVFRAFLRSRAKSFFRRVKACVVFECFTFFPSRVFSTVFFSLINLVFLSLFQALLDPVSETTFFRPSSEHPPPERERERERPP